jgi:spore maturation protein CgeB
MILDTIYDRFLVDLYARQPGLDDQPYDRQIAAIDETFFPCGLTWATPLQQLGHEVRFVAANNAPSQIRWCRDHDRLDLVHDSIEYHRLGWYRWRRKLDRLWYLAIAAAQVRAFRPDILLLPFIYTFESEFLAEVAGQYGVAIGQHAASLPESDLSRFDLIVSSLPNQVAHFRGLGVRSEYLPLSFDPRIAEAVGRPDPAHDVAFLGQVTPWHSGRAAFLRDLAEELPIGFWGDADWGGTPEPKAAHWHGHPALWGLDLYHKMAACRISLNCHIDAAGPYANNLRLYEATGVGSLLLTDAKDNLAELFDPATEIVAYRDTADCARQIRDLLADEKRRLAIAEAGQRRTLNEHNHARRTEELLDLIATLPDRP